ncbi:MAG TPA: hypothetical protein VEX86_00915 [Longimicrobium sp.]|nr:hypothetical protein [Longimicrobium sp.]
MGVIFCLPIEYMRLRTSQPDSLPWYLLFGKLAFLSVAYACFATVASSIMLPDTSGYFRRNPFWGSALGRAFNLSVVLYIALFFGLKFSRRHADEDIRIAGVHVWQWKSALNGTVLGGLLGFALSFFLTLGPFDVALVGTLFAGWRYAVPSAEMRLGGLSLASPKNAVRIASYVMVPVLLWLLLLYQLEYTKDDVAFVTLLLTRLVVWVVAVPAFLWFGGIDLVSHASLRLVLAISRTFPLHLQRFTNHVVSLGFLQRAGGGYMFIHRLLLEHFAASSCVGCSPTRWGGVQVGHPQSSIRDGNGYRPERRAGRSGAWR